MINEYTIREIAINSNFLDSISEYFFGGSGESSASTNVPVKTDAFEEKFDELKADLRNHREEAKKENKLKGWIRYQDYLIIDLYLRVWNDPVQDKRYGILNTIVPEDLFVNIERPLTQEERDKLEQLLKVVMRFAVETQPPMEEFLKGLYRSAREYRGEANSIKNWKSANKKNKNLAKKYIKFAEELESWVEDIEYRRPRLLKTLEKVNEIAKRK